MPPAEQNPDLQSAFSFLILIAGFVILEACSSAAPLVLVPGPWDKDKHEIEDRDGLALPDTPGGRPAGRPGNVIVVDQIRGPGQAPFLAEVLETMAGPHPANPNTTRKPNY